MKIHSRNFVRALRRKVRREVKARPEWRRTARRIWLTNLNVIFDLTALRWVITLLIGGIAAAQAAGPGPWGVLSLWTLLLAGLRTFQYQTLNSRRDGVLVFIGLPLSARQIFDHVAARMLRSSLWVLVDALVALCCFMHFHAPLRFWLGVLPVAVLVELSCLATAIILLWRWPQRLHALYVFLLMVFLAFAVVCLDRMESTLWFGRLATLILWVTPPGWACQLAFWLVGKEQPFPVIPLGLSGVWIAFAVPCYRALAERYRFWETTPPVPVEPAPRESAAGEIVKSETLDETAAPLVTADRVGSMESVRAGGFLRPFSSRSAPGVGWVDRAILACFPREAALLDFLLGRECGWTEGFHLGLLILVLGMLLTFGLKSWNEVVASLVAFATTFLALLAMTPIFGGSWAAFRLGTLSYRAVGLLALLPIDMNAVSRVVLRVNGLRFLLALPCWLAAALMGAWLLHVSPGLAIGVVLKVWLLDLLVQPLFLAFSYSRGTNTSSRLLISILISTLLAILCFLVIVAFLWAISTIFADASLRYNALAFALFAVVSFGFEALYRRLYLRRFDLLAKLPPTTSPYPVG